MVQVDVVSRCGSCFQTNGLADYKRDGLGLRLLHNLGGGGAALGLVQHLVREFMDKRGKFLGFRLAGENGNPAAVADAQRGSDVLGKDKLDALLLDERNKTVAVLAHVAVYLVHGGKLRAVGLRHIEDIGVAKSNQDSVYSDRRGLSRLPCLSCGGCR